MKDRVYLKMECHFNIKTTNKIFKLFELNGSSNTALVEVVQGIVDKNIDREIRKSKHLLKRRRDEKESIFNSRLDQ